MNTRYADTQADSEASPERHLASAKLRGISIGMNIVARVARVLPEPERAAMIWLTNYAQQRDLTADALSDELDLDKAEIRSALSNPDADRTRFVRHVTALRVKHEKSLPVLANTSVTRKVRNAVKFAEGDTSQIVEIVGKTRTGKTVSAWQEYQRRLDHAVWLHCPTGQWRDFIMAMCHALGVAVGSTSLKLGQLIPKVEACFGQNRIRLLFVDEGHRLFPTDLKSPPLRLEFLRDIWERLGVSVIILATPQYSESLNIAMEENPRWAPGQWDGRVQRFHLKETLTDMDLAEVARHHFPEHAKHPEGDAIITQLIDQAKSSEGFCGAMVNAIKRARFIAQMDEKPLSLKTIILAQAELARATRIEQAAKTPGKKIVQMKGASAA